MISVLGNVGQYLTLSFVEGQSTLNWSMTTPSGARYLPGGEKLPGNPDLSLRDTYAFSINAGQGWVRLRASTPVNPRDFLSFRISALSWNSDSWTNATLYKDSSFLTPLNEGLDGTDASNVGFIYVSSDTPVFYAIQASYTLASAPQDNSTTFILEYVPVVTRL